MVGRAVATIVWSRAASTMPSMRALKITSTWRWVNPWALVAWSCIRGSAIGRWGEAGGEGGEGGVDGGGCVGWSGATDGGEGVVDGDAHGGEGDGDGEAGEGSSAGSTPRRSASTPVRASSSERSWRGRPSGAAGGRGRGGPVLARRRLRRPRSWWPGRPPVAPRAVLRHRAGLEAIHELPPPVGVEAEDGLLLAGEVVEHRPWGDAGGGGDVVDRDGVRARARGRGRAAASAMARRVSDFLPSRRPTGFVHGARLRESCRPNVAIVAHVDHGKTTLVDQMLWQSGAFRANQDVAERVMDSMDLEREKGITILAKNTTVTYGDVKINIIDTPATPTSAARWSGGCRWSTACCCWSTPARGRCRRPGSCCARRSRPTCRWSSWSTRSTGPTPASPRSSTRSRSCSSTSTPTSTSSTSRSSTACPARGGPPWSGPPTAPACPRRRPHAALRPAPRAHPGPTYDPEAPLQALVTNLDASPYVGRLALCRVRNGTLRKGQTVAWCRTDGTRRAGQAHRAVRHRGALERVPAERPARARSSPSPASPRSPSARRWPTPTIPRPLPVIHIDEPSLSMTIGINTSPLAGKEGTQLTARLVKGRLDRELVGNVSIRVLPTERPDTWEVQGRGELQLAVLVEMMRREGFELTVGKPQVLTREIDGEGARAGRPGHHRRARGLPRRRHPAARPAQGPHGADHQPRHGLGAPRVPRAGRGLIGFRTEFITETRGTGLLHHVFERMEPWAGEIRARRNGSLVADRSGHDRVRAAQRSRTGARCSSGRASRSTRG